jgi:hyperosmotically inducible protein
MRRVITPALIAIIAVLFAAFGYSGTPDNQRKGHDDAITPLIENESQMAKQIRHNLLMLPYYSIFDDLEFQLNGNIVTLEGACPPEPPWDIKSDAGNAVKKVKGVAKVINNIEVLPLSPMDWQIRRAEAKAIYGNPEIGPLYGYRALPSIHIIVDNGHVTLKGVVDNQFDDTLIHTLANEVPYVFSVTDDLTILGKGQPKKAGS